MHHWGVNDEIILKNKDTIKNVITSKVKDKLWEDKELEGKRKLRYYIDVINPNLENQNYIFVLTSTKKKMKISKIRTSSHELQSEMTCWCIPKTPWDERVGHICNTERVQDEKKFPLDS